MTEGAQLGCQDRRHWQSPIVVTSHGADAGPGQRSLPVNLNEQGWSISLSRISNSGKLASHWQWIYACTTAESGTNQPLS